MKLIVTCTCPSCGSKIPITKSIAARVLQEGRKLPSKEKLSEWGKKGANNRWKIK